MQVGSAGGEVIEREASVPGELYIHAAIPLVGDARAQRLRADRDQPHPIEIVGIKRPRNGLARIAVVPVKGRGEVLGLRHLVGGEIPGRETVRHTFPIIDANRHMEHGVRGARDDTVGDFVRESHVRGEILPADGPFIGLTAAMEISHLTGHPGRGIYVRGVEVRPSGRTSRGRDKSGSS